MPVPLTQTTGRRKQAVARVRFRPGQGAITVNRQPIEAYFTSATHRMLVTEPLVRVMVEARLAAQADAVAAQLAGVVEAALGQVGG